MCPDKIKCPTCGLTDLVEKVSTIYLVGAKEKKLHALSRKLAPPSSGKGSPMRPVHPDTVVIVFSCVLPIFLIGIVNQQRLFLIPAILILAICYGLYFYKRRAIIAKFEQEKKAKQEEQKRIERGIATWMKLYYCGRDDSVFLPGKAEMIPADQMMGYLLGAEYNQRYES